MTRYACKECGAESPAGIGYAVTLNGAEFPTPDESCVNPHVSFDARVQGTRDDWTVTTWADASGVWHARIASPVGWGNAGERDLERHWDAMRSRARRAIVREIRVRQGEQRVSVALEVADNHLDSLNVMRSVTFAERA